MTDWITRLAIALVELYQMTLSRMLGPACRFEPSCSSYAIGCLRAHGFWAGGLLSIRRVCKCHPFHPGGFDPPPPRLTRSSPPTQPSESTIASPARAAD